MTTIKKILSIFLTKIRARWVRSPLLTLLTLGVVAGGGYVYFAWQSFSNFKQDYAVYSELAARQDAAANIVGALNNPVRQKLNQALSDVLVKNMGVQARLKRANEGLELLKDSEDQIGEISVSDEKTATAIAKMQVEMLAGISSSQGAKEIVALAKKHAQVISDIRAYSYRADFEVGQIFNHIIADKGELTDSYIVELNTSIPELESQFNKRSDLYTDLQGTTQQIEKKSSELGLF